MFGGTFDPVHNTHLAIARAAADTFGLEKVIFIPAGNPPLKAGTEASFEDRRRMLELAVISAGAPRFEVSGLESPAENNGALSYSIVTVERLLANGSGPINFIVGADAFAEIQKWYRWQDLVRTVAFIVVPRPGAVYTIPPRATVRELPALNSPDSSSAVRAALRSGTAAVPVAEPVLAYIRDHRLYQSHAA
jgi:nicotinate-nucleotide adenylyltransferase